MSKRKHIVITRLFEFGGSNTHLKTLIKYFGKENMLLVVDNEEQMKWLPNIENANGLSFKVMARLHKFAHLVYPSVLSNIKEAYSVIRSMISTILLRIKYGSTDITISSTEPEKYLYLLWLPFIRVVYILHTTPGEKFTSFTTRTCNKKLSEKKLIATVSEANKEEICRQWGISPAKQQFVKVIYNCLLEEPAIVYHPKISNNHIKNVITMGKVIDYKNPHVWFEVAKRITREYNDVYFTWLGDGPLWDHFNHITKDNDQINFPGYVSDTSEYLLNAILYYQPSLYETHGIGVLEAMGYYLPSVVANAGGLPESVQSNYNGLLADPNDTEANVEAITRLINNNALLASFGANAHKKYIDLFTFEKFKVKMNAIYNN